MENLSPHDFTVMVLLISAGNSCRRFCGVWGRAVSHQFPAAVTQCRDVLSISHLAEPAMSSSLTCPILASHPIGRECATCWDLPSFVV